MLSMFFDMHLQLSLYRNPWREYSTWSEDQTAPESPTGTWSKLEVPASNEGMFLDVRAAKDTNWQEHIQVITAYCLRRKMSTPWRGRSLMDMFAKCWWCTQIQAFQGMVESTQQENWWHVQVRNHQSMGNVELIEVGIRINTTQWAIQSAGL